MQKKEICHIKKNITSKNQKKNNKISFQVFKHTTIIIKNEPS